MKHPIFLFLFFSLVMPAAFVYSEIDMSSDVAGETATISREQNNVREKDQKPNNTNADMPSDDQLRKIIKDIVKELKKDDQHNNSSDKVYNKIDSSELQEMKSLVASLNEQVKNNKNTNGQQLAVALLPPQEKTFLKAIKRGCRDVVYNIVVEVGKVMQPFFVRGIVLPTGCIITILVAGGTLWIFQQSGIMEPVLVFFGKEVGKALSIIAKSAFQVVGYSSFGILEYFTGGLLSTSLELLSSLFGGLPGASAAEVFSHHDSYENFTYAADSGGGGGGW